MLYNRRRRSLRRPIILPHSLFTTGSTAENGLQKGTSLNILDTIHCSQAPENRRKVIFTSPFDEAHTQVLSTIIEVVASILMQANQGERQAVKGYLVRSLWENSDIWILFLSLLYRDTNTIDRHDTQRTRVLHSTISIQTITRKNYERLRYLHSD